MNKKKGSNNAGIKAMSAVANVLSQTDFYIELRGADEFNVTFQVRVEQGLAIAGGAGVGAVVGASIGFFFGGPIGAAAGASVGGGLSAYGTGKAVGATTQDITMYELISRLTPAQRGEMWELVHTRLTQMGVDAITAATLRQASVEVNRVIYQFAGPIIRDQLRRLTLAPGKAAPGGKRIK